jgi:hypothetical protein
MVKACGRQVAVQRVVVEQVVQFLGCQVERVRDLRAVPGLRLGVASFPPDYRRAVNADPLGEILLTQAEHSAALDQALPTQGHDAILPARGRLAGIVAAQRTHAPELPH